MAAIGSMPAARRVGRSHAAVATRTSEPATSLKRIGRPDAEQETRERTSRRAHRRSRSPDLRLRVETLPEERTARGRWRTVASEKPSRQSSEPHSLWLKSQAPFPRGRGRAVMGNAAVTIDCSCAPEQYASLLTRQPATTTRLRTQETKRRTHRVSALPYAI